MTVHLEDLRVTHRGSPLVDVAELRLTPGRPLTVVGESGSGKSLLAHAVMGTLPPELEVSGRLVVEGIGYRLEDRTDRRRAWGSVIALLPQEPALALDPTMRVRHQVAEGSEHFTTDRRAAHRAATEGLASLGLDGVQDHFPHTLSGGMAQRVAFAAATVGRARVLLADEPSKGLDPAARSRLARLLGRHVEGGGALLTITHDLDLARRLGGDVVVMRQATVVESGSVESVLSAPTHSYTRQLLAAEPSRWGRAPHDPGARAAQGVPLLEARGVTHGYGAAPLFADLSLSVAPGERIAVHGPSGSGKTTLGRVLLKLLRPDGGQVHHAPGLGRGRLQKLYQEPALAFPAQVPTGAALRDLLRRHRIEPGRLEELMTAVGLDAGLLARRPGQLSGGELQRLAVVRAMLVEPLLLFADEPTSRLDLLTQQVTMTTLLEQVERHECALVLVTHDRALADAVAERRVDLADRRPPEAVRAG